MLGDIQIKMRLKVSGSRDEVRQDYMPLLASKIVLPLTRKDEAAVRSLALVASAYPGSSP